MQKCAMACREPGRLAADEIWYAPDFFQQKTARNKITSRELTYPTDKKRKVIFPTAFWMEYVRCWDGNFCGVSLQNELSQGLEAFVPSTYTSITKESCHEALRVETFSWV